MYVYTYADIDIDTDIEMCRTRCRYRYIDINVEIEVDTNIDIAIVSRVYFLNPIWDLGQNIPFWLQEGDGYYPRPDSGDWTQEVMPVILEARFLRPQAPKAPKNLATLT